MQWPIYFSAFMLVANVAIGAVSAKAETYLFSATPNKKGLTL